jgi:hypothetical protein
MSVIQNAAAPVSQKTRNTPIITLVWLLDVHANDRYLLLQTTESLQSSNSFSAIHLSLASHVPGLHTRIQFMILCTRTVQRATNLYFYKKHLNYCR